ncbi:hypothetical protein [Aquisalinus flavus]|uniref:Uncharacterized protein n=1 Tax=Aquisalinus flavus TaxID=1526572 RepID=A0A8J2V5H8_9PROT|nr:hypothetical protein [Aquisalinus flavus]MBD0426421.1 hypothetical protein [Aquisalinus flavus]UNE48024.1 hypothetical protein FF099_08160 [Aquisalinus flavus]GGD08043.1 hypothetical protein GCM10011342_16150 [Aquisalinus flavus]
MTDTNEPGDSSADSPYGELKRAVADYGKAAMDNLLHCKAFGRAVMEGYAGWLGCEPERVVGVPAKGQFDPHHDYGDAAFSFYQSPVIRLEPVTFGICLTIDNVEDSGSLWLRTAIRVDMAGTVLEVFVGTQPMVNVPVEFDGQLDPVFRAIHKEMMSVFSQELQEFRDDRFRGGIGFIAD